jgi:multiple sugar transport system substrate-binding protein
MSPMRAASEAWAARDEGCRITWETRSLTQFGDQPLEDLAHRFDLLVVDHPFAGTAHRTGCLLPLDACLPDDVLRELAEDAIGPSHESYRYAGRQWGLATDAACQVSAIRDDLLLGHAVPRSWDEVLALGRALPGRVAIPLRPADAICSFLTLCASLGAPAAEEPRALVERGTGLLALSWLRDLVRVGHPDSLACTPPLALDRMASSEEIAYVPLTFGYSTYSRPDAPGRRLRFLDIPSADGSPHGSILGGAGLAVSAASEHVAEAASFAAWATAGEAQRAILVPAGGQPGSRAAWLDPHCDCLTGGFFSGTLGTIEAAWVRPREPWWPRFQLEAGEALHRLLGSGPAATEMLDALEAVYRSARLREDK